MNLPLKVVPLTEDHAVTLCSWRYPAPYHIFNWPDWSDMVEGGTEFGDPAIREEQYAAILDHSGEMIGFAQFFPMAGLTRLGFGLHPNLCGRGFGPVFVKSIAEEAKRRNPANEIDLEVLSWNVRAQKAYTKTGFVHTDTYERMTPDGIEEFHCMVYSVEFANRRGGQYGKNNHES